MAPKDLRPALLAAADWIGSQVAAPVHAPAADVVVSVDLQTLVDTGRDLAQQDADTPEEPERRKRRGGSVFWEGARIDDGPALSAALLQTLACDGRVQLSVRAGDGRELNLGRRRRYPSPAQLGVLWRRDRGCAHPGCGRTRFLHAHHVIAWAVGGRTDLDNLILLCGQHHRLLHDGGFGIVALGKQKFRFHGPHGAERPTAPLTRGDADALVAAHADITPTTIEPDWDGSPLDLPHATDVYLSNWANAARRRQAEAEAAAESDGAPTAGSTNYTYYPADRPDCDAWSKPFDPSIVAGGAAAQ